MKCSKEQYNEIRDVLLENGFEEEYKDINKTNREYLVNNYNERDKLLSFTYMKSDYNRTIFETWDKDIFLEYCGIEVFPEKLCVIHLQEVADYIIELIGNNSGNWNEDLGLYAHFPPVSHTEDYCYNKIQPGYKEISIKQFRNKYLTLKKETMQKLTVPIQDVIRIHASISNSCGWKKKVAEYLSRVDVFQNITFTQQELDAGYEVANKDQCILLDEIFGERNNFKFKIGDYLYCIKKPNMCSPIVGQVYKIEQDEKYLKLNDGFCIIGYINYSNCFRLATPEEIEEYNKSIIDYDKLKTGSVVKIKYTGSHCNSSKDIDMNEEFNIVFFKTPHFINVGGFQKDGPHSLYSTFEQKGKFIIFSADNYIDYITEVISY